MPVVPTGLREALDEFAAVQLGSSDLTPRKHRAGASPQHHGLWAFSRSVGFADAELVSYATPYEHHYVVRIGDLILDPSARQFDPTADVPALRTATELRNEWGDADVVKLNDLWHRKLWGLPETPPPWSIGQWALPAREPR
jgi:hypothetical protein